MVLIGMCDDYILAIQVLYSIMVRASKLHDKILAA